MAVLQEYKCPCCGGAIAFDSGIQKMKCPFCDTEFEMEALAAYDSELNNEQADALQWEHAPTERNFSNFSFCFRSIDIFLDFSSF